MKTLKPIWLTRGIIIDKVNTHLLTMPMGRERHLNYCSKTRKERRQFLSPHTEVGVSLPKFDEY